MPVLACMHNHLYAHDLPAIRHCVGGERFKLSKVELAIDRRFAGVLLFPTAGDE